MKCYGLDLGKGYTKLYDGSRLISFPSVVGHPERIKYSDSLGLSPTLVPGGIHLETEAGPFYVGELALSQSSLNWTMMDRTDVADQMKLVLTLAALSELKASGPLKLVTGVPVTWFGHKGAVQDLLQGEHSYTRAGKRYTVIIEEVSVVTEPHGTAFSLAIDGAGKLINPALAGGLLGVIDIGMHTADFLLLDKLGYLEPASGSEASGMSHVYEMVAREIQNRFDVHGLEPHQVDRLIRVGSIDIGPDSHSLAPIVEPALQGLARKVVGRAVAQPSPYWKNGGRLLPHILISGGGAHHLGSYLTHTYPHADILAGAATANARGFYNAAIYKWGQPAPKPSRQTRIKQNGAVKNAAA